MTEKLFCLFFWPLQNMEGRVVGLSGSRVFVPPFFSISVASLMDHPKGAETRGVIFYILDQR